MISFGITNHFKSCSLQTSSAPNLPFHKEGDRTLQGAVFLPAVRSQISTITVATFNTTLASFNVGYADFFSEHMRKLCNQVPIPELPHEPLACANLPRSLTDSCINYSCLEDTDHMDGTNSFVHKNGMLDLSVIGKERGKPGPSSVNIAVPLRSGVGWAFPPALCMTSLSSMQRSVRYICAHPKSLL